MSSTQEPRQWGDDAFDPGKVARRTFLILRSAAAITLPFRCVRGGIESPGFSGVIACLAMLLWAMQTNDLLVFRYWQAWLVALAIYRLRMDRMAHSQYEGRHWLAGLLTKKSSIACTIEPVLVLGIGYLVHRFAPALGLMLLVSGVAIAANEITDWKERRKTQIAYRDSQIEMRMQREMIRRN